MLILLYASLYDKKSVFSKAYTLRSNTRLASTKTEARHDNGYDFGS